MQFFHLYLIISYNYFKIKLLNCVFSTMNTDDPYDTVMLNSVGLPALSLIYLFSSLKPQLILNSQIDLSFQLVAGLQKKHHVDPAALADSVDPSILFGVCLVFVCTPWYKCLIFTPISDISSTQFSLEQYVLDK